MPPSCPYIKLYGVLNPKGSGSQQNSRATGTAHACVLRFCLGEEAGEHASDRTSSRQFYRCYEVNSYLGTKHVNGQITTARKEERKCTSIHTDGTQGDGTYAPPIDNVSEKAAEKEKEGKK